jgi:signal transduction histidine kinase
MRITMTGETPVLPLPVARAAHRVVQEALTNAAKHAPAAPVTVDLGRDRNAGEVIVTVRNPLPSEPSPAVPSGGSGLVSLDERVRTVGGRLLVRRTDGTFAVTARIPLGPGPGPRPSGHPAEQRVATMKA